MEYEIMAALFSAATFCCVWLFSKPQNLKIEAIKEKMEADNEASHAALDRNSEAIEKLTQELQESREDRAKFAQQIKTLFGFYKDLKGDMDKLQQNMLQCRTGNKGDNTCLRK